MIEERLPIQKLTAGPNFYWFGYYDKLEFDSTGRYLLAMESDFEGRMPDAGDVIRIGMLDLAEGNRWTELGASSAWCWQQGCMLQWLPDHKDQIIWNDREGDSYVCRILNVTTGQMRTVPHAVYSVSPDGNTAVAADFRRINDMRPGYGYAGLPDPWADELAPQEAGIWRVDLQTGQSELIISLAQIASIPNKPADASKAKHYFNHLLFSPDGQRFIFLNRWGSGSGGRWGTRMFAANPDGSAVRLVTDGQGKPVSHFIWQDPKHINAWVGCMSGFAVFPDDGGGQGELMLEARDGHQSYLPGNEWMLFDCYPRDEQVRRLMLYHIAEKEVVEIGRFASPAEYAGPLRCDLHPRFSPDGSKVVIDSVHEGDGRQLYMLDLLEVTDAWKSRGQGRG